MCKNVSIDIIIIKNEKFITENSLKYIQNLPGLFFVYSLRVIRLARDAINVPAPPMFTPIKRCA